MAQQNERRIRQQNPEAILGVNEQKLRDTIATITHQVGQKGKTVMKIFVTIDCMFSPREVQTLAVLLARYHNLGLRVQSVDHLWRNNLYCEPARQAVQ